MARDKARSASVYSGSLNGFVRAISQEKHSKIHEIWQTHIEFGLRIGMPIAICVLIVLLIGIDYLQFRAEHYAHYRVSAEEIETLASLSARAIDAQKSQSDKLDLPNELSSHHWLVLLAKSDGSLVFHKDGTTLPGLSQTPTWQKLLGQMSQAKYRGVQTVDFDNQTGLIAVHPLAPPYKYVAIVHLAPNGTYKWNVGILRTHMSVLMACAALFLTGLVFLWQSFRAKKLQLLGNKLRERIDLALMRGHCGVWDWDLVRGRFYCSSSMYQLLGLSPIDDYLPQSIIADLINGEDSDLESHAQRLLQNDQPTLEAEFRVRHYGGHWIWLRVRAERVVGETNAEVHFIGVASDVTKERHLAECSASADIRLHDAIETVSEAFVLWDTDNRLIMCNSKFEKLHNLPPNCTRSGTSYAEIMAQGTLPSIQTQIDLVDHGPRGERSYEARLADGRWLQVNERRTNDGGYVSVGTDISALKEHEAKLVDSERQLRHTIVDLRSSQHTLELQAQQLAELAEKYYIQKAHAEIANQSKSKFLANMSHELRTPLNHIIGFAEVMIHETFGLLGHDKYREYCQDIAKSGAHLLDVINDILDMARLEAGNFTHNLQECSLNRILDQALAEMAELAEAKNICIEKDLNCDLTIFADPLCLAKIFKTLVSNALKFTGTGGRIEICGTRHNDHLYFSIEDNGVGISPQDLAKIGRPFEQAGGIIENGMQGSGLGLAIARSLVELHEGILEIHSKHGVGTTIKVQLPDRPRNGILMLLASAA